MLAQFQKLAGAQLSLIAARFAAVGKFDSGRWQAECALFEAACLGMLQASAGLSHELSTALHAGYECIAQLLHHLPPLNAEGKS